MSKTFPNATLDAHAAIGSDNSNNRDRLELLLRARLQHLRTDSPTDQHRGELYRAHVNPDLHDLLAALDLDRTYVHGAGCTLTDSRGRTCLDFAGAYGALPLGHNPEVAWEALDRTRRSGEPAFVQPSILGAAADLAAALVNVAPGHLSRVTFANSGAEAVEAAVKLARAGTARLGVVSTINSFHGKTLGALSATGNPAYQSGFGAPATGFRSVAFGDIGAMRDSVFADPPAAVLVEPIQGEGGVHVPPPGYLTALRELCDETGTALIVDEVQTGLGRTGPLFAVEREGVVPDVLTIAKALGGGILPISAVLASPAMMTEHFALRHTSTFGGGAPACRVGLAILDQLTQPALRRNVEDRSAQLRAGLEVLARRHPSIITGVRGEGLLLGLELAAEIRLVGRQSLIGSLADSENLGMVLASHLLARHEIRVAPTLFGNRVLRIEPPLTVTETECTRLLTALESTMHIVAAGDTSALLGHLVGRPPMRTWYLATHRTRRHQAADTQRSGVPLNPTRPDSHLSPIRLTWRASQTSTTP